MHAEQSTFAEVFGAMEVHSSFSIEYFSQLFVKVLI